MGSGWVRHVRWVAAVSGVDVGVESERFVGIALQGSDAVVMRASQSVADGEGEQRVGADFDERRVVLGGRGDGLAEPHRIAQIGRPVVGVENDCTGASLIVCADESGDRRPLRVQVGKRTSQFGQYRIDGRVVGGTVTVTSLMDAKILVSTGNCQQFT